jgi:hypothetical protein
MVLNISLQVVVKERLKYIKKCLWKKNSNFISIFQELVFHDNYNENEIIPWLAHGTLWKW